MTDLPPELLDARTPPDVVVTDVVPPRIEDPTLGVALGEHAPGVPPPPSTSAAPLVTVGDSLTHGLSSGAVFHTRLSWPALVAEALGVRLDVPSYAGPLDGLPVNIEALLRQLGQRFGDDLSVWEVAQVPVVLQRILDDNEDYWERGAGARPPATDVRFHNLGIYGWDVRDALSYRAARAVTLAATPQRDTLLGAKPAHDNDIAAASVLAPFGPEATQMSAAAWHGRTGGIDTLVVALGANNALDAVVSKRVCWSDAGYDDLDRKGVYNVWRPTHFAAEYGQLVAELKSIRAARVALATVPHVTVAPIAKGVNPTDPGNKWRPGSRYFPYYTDPWIEESEFRPAKHRHITHQQARAIDSAIDQYNRTICDATRQARGEGRDWYVFDMCGLLDSLAYRRFERDHEAARRNGWQGYELPAPISGLDTRFFRSNVSGRNQGGLFGLDAIHPTTCGYGIVAHELLFLLASAGVASTPIDFAALLKRDTLNSAPPELLDDVLAIAAPIATRFVSRT